MVPYSKVRENACLKLRCDTRFHCAFIACGCIFKVIMLVGSNTALRSKKYGMDMRSIIGESCNLPVYLTKSCIIKIRLICGGLSSIDCNKNENN